MLISRSSVVRFKLYLFTSIAFKFRRLWEPKHHQQQQAASTTAGGKDKCYSPPCYSLSLFLFFSLVSRHLPTLSLPLSSPIHLSLALVSFSWLHQRLRMHACEATSAARVVRATQTQPLYTRSLCFSLFLSHSFNTINLSVRYSDLVAKCARK